MSHLVDQRHTIKPAIAMEAASVYAENTLGHHSRKTGSETPITDGTREFAKNDTKR